MSWLTGVLDGLGVDRPQLVLVAARAKTHNADRLTQRVTALDPKPTVVHLETATHHSLPALHADEVVKALSA